MKTATAVTGLLLLLAAPAWSLFETNSDLVATAKISLEEAIRHALESVPGKAVEAEIRKDDGRIVYAVEIVDRGNKTQTVFVDAQNGKTKIDQ